MVVEYGSVAEEKTPNASPETIGSDDTDKLMLGTPPIEEREIAEAILNLHTYAENRARARTLPSIRTLAHSRSHTLTLPQSRASSRSSGQTGTESKRNGSYSPVIGMYRQPTAKEDSDSDESLDSIT